MKSKTIFGLIAGLILAFAMQDAAAYHGYDGTEIILSADDGFSTRDYRYHDSYYGNPQYRVYVDDDYNDYYNRGNYYGNVNYNGPTYFGQRNRYRYYDLSNVKKYYRNKAIARFVDRSAYSRYDINYGKDSGEAFCNTVDCVDENPASTNWRYKYTYDPRIDGLGNNQDYYYKPQYDSDLGYFNWRY